MIEDSIHHQVRMNTSVLMFRNMTGFMQFCSHRIDAYTDPNIGEYFTFSHAIEVNTLRSMPRNFRVFARPENKI